MPLLDGHQLGFGSYMHYPFKIKKYLSLNIEHFSFIIRY